MRAKRLAVFTAFGLLALGVAVFASSGTGAGIYRPQSSYSVAIPAAGAVANTSMSFTIPAPDYNYEDSSMYAFAPIDWWMAPGNTVPIGAGMGQLSSLSTLGVLNEACNIPLYPLYNLYNASVDTSTPLTPAAMAWTNTSDPVPTGTYIPGLPDYLARYPHFLNEMLDPDGPAGPKLPLQPRARYAGHISVVGTNWLIEIVVLSPGQITQLPGIKAQMVSALGSVFLTVLNNPVDQADRPGAISDVCTPVQSTTTLYGATTDNPATAANEAGYTAQRNPAANTGVLGTGTHIARTYSQSERDADNDGWENDMDPCFYQANPGWDPRVSPPTPCGAGKPGDVDCDGLPDICDPEPNGAPDGGVDCAVGAPQYDCDNDGYNNQQDICPLVADGPASGQNQIDSDGLVENADLGPKPDSIGNACDDSDNDGLENGSSTGVAGSGNCTDGIDNGDGDGLPDMLDPQCLLWTDKGEIAAGRTTAQIYGTNPGTGLYYHTMPWSAVCIGATDTDGDGYCDSLESILGSPTNNGAETGAQCDNDSDDDGDGYVNDGCPQVGHYAESGAQCANAVSDDTPTPDNGAYWGEVAVGVHVNDGCPVIGVPESLVIDAQISGAGFSVRPEAQVRQSCSDGVDNDGDGLTDAADNGTLGCEPATYAGDIDRDGVADASDNCPAAWNPEQTNTDGDAPGDVCDADDDNDGLADGVDLDPLVASTAFDDQGLGGTTFGEVLIKGGLSVGVSDRPSPAGVRIVAGGSGGPAMVRICGTTIVKLDSGDEIALTCGSATIEVVVGPIEATFGAFQATLPPDTTATIAELAPGAFEVTNSAGSSAPITVNGIQIPPGGSESDSDGDAFFTSIEQYVGTDPLDACPDVVGADDAWPLDINMSKTLTVVGDVLMYAGRIGSTGGPPPSPNWWGRLDLNVSGTITVVGDVLLYAGKIGTSCT